MAAREFLLRRITWLSTYQYGILASVARIGNARRDGQEAGEEEDLLAAFVAEAAAARGKLTHLREDRRGKLLAKIAKKASGQH